MRKLLAALLIAAPLCAQNPNPQPNFANAVAVANPSHWLRMNDATAAFSDPVTASTVQGVEQTGGQWPSALTFSGSGGYVVFTTPGFAASGPLEAVTVQTYAAPSPGQLLTICIFSGSGTSYTIADSFTVTLAATTAPQIFYAGTDFSPRSVTAGEFIGTWASSAGSNVVSANGTFTGSQTYFYLAAASSLPAGAQTYSTSSANSASATIGYVGNAGITVQQPGFDGAQANNFSAAFAQNSLAIAPSTSYGDLEWSNSWSIHVDVDRMNYDRAGPLVLASKGDTNPSDLQSYWELVVQMNSGSSQLCFNMQAVTPGYGGGNVIQMQICTTPGLDAVPNGFNYNIDVENAGGGWTSDFVIWINGIPVGPGAIIPGQNNAHFATGFNPANITITNGGTGYAASTNFTSTGGGAHCVVTGVMGASGGVINGVALTQSSGCTSNPTIVLTAPTGTGATFTTTALTSTLSTSTTNRLLLGTIFGMSPDSGQAPTYIDEFAEFSPDLTGAQLTNINYWTAFYQTGNGLSYPPPAVPPVLFIDNDTGDPDNQYALAAAIGMDLRGYLKLEGINESSGDQVCEQMWQQMLNQAGLAHIPLTTSASSAGSPNCYTADINTYNASTPSPAFNSSTALYRKVFAANPTRPIYVQLTGQWTGMSNFMQSGPDGISSLTGQQLMDQNAANGGAIFAQGLECLPATTYVPTPCSASVTGDNSLVDPAAGQYVVNHNGATPIYFYGGIPASTGPGVQYGRTAKDPLFLYGASHTYTRQAYDSLALAAMLTPIFSRGVMLTVSGGTGYASETPFNSTGGGSLCNVRGWMTASGGVPTGFVTQWQTAQDTFSGIGYGCTSTPTINLIGATGTGATIIPALTAVCGTVTITTVGTPTANITSATCSNHYFLPYSAFSASPGIGTALPTFSMFLNSFIDPPPTGQPRMLQQ